MARREREGGGGGRGASEYHTHHEVEEGTRRPGCRSKYWASYDRRDELCVIREVVRDELSQMSGEQRDGFRKIMET